MSLTHRRYLPTLIKNQVKVQEVRNKNTKRLTVNTKRGIIDFNIISETVVGI